MRPLNRERKIILAIGAALILAGGVYRLLPFFEAMGVDGESLALKERKLAGYMALVGERNDLEARKTFLVRTVERAEANLLTGGSPALGAVDLQNRVTEICDRGRLQVKTMRVLKPEPLFDGQYMGIPIEVTLEASISQMEELFYRLESLEKFVTVKKLQVTATGDALTLNVTFTAEGYMTRQSG